MIPRPLEGAPINASLDDLMNGLNHLDICVCHWFHSFSPLAFVVRVTNTGGLASDFVVLGFLSSDHAGAPLRELFGYERVGRLEAGQSTAITLRVREGSQGHGFSSSSARSHHVCAGHHTIADERMDVSEPGPSAGSVPCGCGWE
jgi:hypothetical protein